MVKKGRFINTRLSTWRTAGGQETLASAWARSCHFCLSFGTADASRCPTEGHRGASPCAGWPFGAADLFHVGDGAVSRRRSRQLRGSVPGQMPAPSADPATWQGGRLLSPRACVTALACCWDRANKPFIPPEETKWQALGRQLPVGKGHAPAQSCASGLEPPKSQSDVYVTVPFFSPSYNYKRYFTYTSEITHGFALSVFTF